MAFTFSSTAGTSGISVVTLSASSSTELYNIIENFTLANESNHSLLMPVVQRAYVPSQPYINLIPSATTWPSSGGYQTIQVQTNQDWVWEMDEWLMPSSTGGTSGNTIIPIYAGENTGNTRTGEIKAVCLSDSSVTASTTVEQAGSYVKPFIELGYYMYMATPESASTAVTVASNIDWQTMTDARWIDINTLSGSGNGSISFTVDENTAEFNREGTITVFNYDHDIYVELVVRQQTAVKPFIVLNPDSFIVDATGSTGNVITVSANCDYDIEADVDWITVDAASGSGYGSVTFSTNPTDRAITNIGNIVFSNSAVSSYASVERKQSEPQPYIYSDVSAITHIYGQETVVNAKIYTNRRWDCSILYYNYTGHSQHITVSPRNGSGDTDIVISISSATTATGGRIRFNANDSGFSPYFILNISMEEVPHNMIYYTSDNDSVVIPKSNYFGANLVSNDYEDGKGVMVFDGDVTSIPASAFSGSTTLVSMKIPHSVTSIGNYAFRHCSALTGFTFVPSLNSIGELSFANTNLSGDLTIGENITQLGRSAFSSGNVSTINVQLPSECDTVPDTCFAWNYITTSITVGNNVRIIEPYAFENCYNTLALPNLSDYINRDPEGVLVLGSSVSAIGNYAFTVPWFLKTIYSYNPIAPTLGTHNFDYMADIFTGSGWRRGNGIIHYPAGADYSSWQNYNYFSGCTFIGDL